MSAEAAEIRAREYPRCSLCGSGGEELHAGLADRLFGAPSAWKMKQCLNPGCGLLWLDPMPLAEDIGVAYKSYYTHRDSGEGRGKSLSRLMMDRLRQVLAVATGLNAAKQARNYQYLGSKPAGRLLDVGCGAGEYLNLMRDRGWAVEGVDFDVEAVKKANERFGIRVHAGQLHEVNFPDGCFDAITMNHLIEHVFDPVSLLRECRRLLRPDGCLVIVTPNADSLGHARFSGHWRGLEPPRHLHVFSPASLLLLGTSAGFDTAEVFTTSANAEGVFRESFSIRKANESGKQEVDYSLTTFERLGSVFLQAYETWKIGSRPMIGEEVVMISRTGGES